MICKFHERCKRVETMLSTDLLIACIVTGYDTSPRDTTHRFDGIRYTHFAGYGTPVSRDTAHRNNQLKGLKPLPSKPCRMTRKLTNLILIIFKSFFKQQDYCRFSSFLTVACLGCFNKRGQYYLA
jgi:hypothetical protein